MKSDFRIYRRDLPHWRQTGRTYFVTWRLRKGIAELGESERDCVSEAVRRFHGSKYWLHAFVVMDDHLHVLVSPIALHSLESIVGPWKSITTRRIWESSGRTGKIWQEEYFDRIVRDQEEFLEKARYILNNPLKRWPELRDYRWVGAENEWSEGAGTASRPHQDA